MLLKPVRTAHRALRLPCQVVMLTAKGFVVGTQLGREASDITGMMKLMVVRQACQREPTHGRPREAVATVIVIAGVEQPHHPLDPDNGMARPCYHHSKDCRVDIADNIVDGLAHINTSMCGCGWGRARKHGKQLINIRPSYEHTRQCERAT